MKYQRIVLVSVLLLAGGFLAIYFLYCDQGVQRELSLSDFEFLKRGMGLKEIVSKLGKPDRVFGSGILIAQYDLLDGQVVELTFVGSGGLLGAEVRGKDGSVINLLER